MKKERIWEILRHMKDTMLRKRAKPVVGKYKIKKKVVLSTYMYDQKRLCKGPYAAHFKGHVYSYPVPSNLNYFWNFGSLLGFFLCIQVLTGLFLAMHYTPDTSEAFRSVEAIMRDVNCGSLIRYLHSNGASLLFVIMYFHLGRSIYYRTYRNAATWFTGLVLFVLMMATGFLGYVLPWGQMSLWGATVITNLFGAIPVIGEKLVVLLWGGFSVDNPTLQRFFILHYLIPLIVLLLVAVHILFLHFHGSAAPLGGDSIDMVQFCPKYSVKDILGCVVIFGISLISLIYYYPNWLGHPDNSIMANALVTPKHITPEWYFEPFYAILRSIPNKLGGVVVMALSILVLGILPLFNFSMSTSRYAFISQVFFWLFVINFILLGWLGTCPVEDPYIFYSRVATAIYFSYFLIFLPILSYMENKTFK